MSLRFALQDFDFGFHFFERVTLDNQKDHENVHGQDRKEEDFVHGRIEAGTGTAHDDGRRMLRAPPADSTEDKRHIQESEYPEQRTEQGAAVRFLDQTAQQQIRDIEEPEDKG